MDGSALSSFKETTYEDEAPSKPSANFPRIPSLVFDIELDESSKGCCGYEDDYSGIKELRSWLLPGSSAEKRLRSDIELSLDHHQAASAGSLLENTTWLATKLGRLGYRVHIRTALGGGEGFDCLRNLRHVFLTVGGQGQSPKFVVDLTFKEQFKIAKPTPRYAALLECLPDLYVAPEASVAPLVNFMCAEMACAFRAHGSVLPPWRHASSMLSKWLPRKSLDETVDLSLAAAAASAASQISQQQQHVPDASNPSSQAAANIPGSGAPLAAPVPANALGRRSMEAAAPGCGPLPVKGHWTVPPGLAMQQQVHAHLGLGQVGGGGMFGVHMGCGGASSRLSPSKPISCVPRKVVVGGDFVSVGIA